MNSLSVLAGVAALGVALFPTGRPRDSVALNAAAGRARRDVWILVTEVFDTGPAEPLLIGEAVSVWAFGVSWLRKGLEVDMLRGKTR